MSDGASFKPYVNDRLIDQRDGFYVIVPVDKEKNVPLTCEVCKCLMRTSDDETSYLAFSCCHACALAWAHPRRSEWMSGWRPSASDVEVHLKNRPGLMFSI